MTSLFQRCCGTTNLIKRARPLRTTSIALLAAATCITLPAHAIFKCTVDGKATYQEKPCDDDVKRKGGESTVAPSSRRGDLITPQENSKAENDRRRSVSVSDLEPLARNAFAALRGGRVMDYRDMTCRGARAAMNKPDYASGMKREGQDYANRRMELGKAEVSDEMGSTFLATEEKDLTRAQKQAEQLYVRVNLQWEEGKACVGNIQAYSKPVFR